MKRELELRIEEDNWQELIDKKTGRVFSKGYDNINAVSVLIALGYNVNIVDERR